MSKPYKRYVRDPNDVKGRRKPRPVYYGSVVDEHGRRREVKLLASFKDSEQLLSHLRSQARFVAEGMISRSDVKAASVFSEDINAVRDRWRTSMAGRRCSADHIKRSINCLNKVVRDMGITCIADFDARKMNEYLDRRVVHENIGLATRHEYLKACRAFCNWAVGRESSPLRGMRSRDPRRDPRYPNRAMTRDELRQFFANPNLSPSHRAFYLIAARTGGRWSEIERLRWEHVDFDAREIDYSADIAKTGERGVVPMRPEVSEALLAIRPGDARPTDRLFERRPCPKTWKRHLKQAGLEYGRKGERVLDRKCFRKTFASHLIADGVQPRVLQLLMRHADISTTMSHYSDPALLDVTAALSTMESLSSCPHNVRTESFSTVPAGSQPVSAASA